MCCRQAPAFAGVLRSKVLVTEMSVLSSLAGAPLVKGKRQKNMTTRISGEFAALVHLHLVRHSEEARCKLPGQRADVPKAEASKAGQVSPDTCLYLTPAQ